MLQILAVVMGAVVGAAAGFFLVTALVGEIGGNGQAGIAGLVLGAPPGLVLGAVVGWFLARRPTAPAPGQ